MWSHDQNVPSSEHFREEIYNVLHFMRVLAKKHNLFPWRFMFNPNTLKLPVSKGINIAWEFSEKKWFKDFLNIFIKERRFWKSPLVRSFFLILFSLFFLSLSFSRCSEVKHNRTKSNNETAKFPLFLQIPAKWKLFFWKWLLYRSWKNP